jgi:hypothetical protein
MQRYLAHHGCDHAIAITQSRSRNRYLAIAIAIAVAITQPTLRHFRGDYPCCDCAFANRPIASS